MGDEDYADFFQFQVTETSIVNLGLSGLSADADVAVYKDKNNDGELGGDEIISAGERSGAENETIENVILDPGKYFLSVEAYEGNTNYSLSLAGVAGTVAPDLAGDRPSTARLLSADGEVELHDYVGGADAMDAYRLEVLNPGYLDVSTDNRKANLDLNVTVWSDRNSNDRLDADEIVAEGTNSIQQDNINPGTYYVNVTAPGTATPYKISAISELGSRVDIESYTSLYAGVPTTGTLTQNDNFDPKDEENYADPYLIPELGAGLTVTVTQESEDFDASLRVVDLLTGKVIVENDDINPQDGNFNAQVSFTTEERGKYVVYASSVDAPGLGDYTLNTTVTGTPIESTLRSASADTLKPPDVPKFQVNLEGQNINVDTIYKPLTGGQISSIPINSINQNNFGDCFFLAALTSTFGQIDKNLSNANSKESAVLKKAISTDGTKYAVTFYHNLSNKPETITVDNQVLAYPKELTTPSGKKGTINPSLYGASWIKPLPLPEQASGKPIAASVFERAFAVWKGSYATINAGGNPGDALRWITGKRTDVIQWKPDSEKPEYQLVPAANFISGNTYNSPFPKVTKDELFTTIKTTLDGGGYLTAGTPGSGDDTKQLYNGVLYQSHAYSVHNAYEKDGQKLILLRNPHGIDNTNGKNRSPVKAAEDPSNDLKDGFITIKFDAFLKNFDSLNLLKP